MVCLCVWCFQCVYVFFFFKQKTAYEMRISDWSSDVCSSDLACNSRTASSTGLPCASERASAKRALVPPMSATRRLDGDIAVMSKVAAHERPATILTKRRAQLHTHVAVARIRRASYPRSEERRVATECVSPCSSRRTQAHNKKK